MIKKSIFRTYDIRGKAGIDLDTENARQIARAFAAYLVTERQTRRVVIGYDLRPNSAEMASALCKGFAESGCHVLNIGLVATPVLYYEAARLDAGGAMVTASHLGKEYNGLKLMVGREAIYGDTLKTLYDRIQAKDFVQGSGSCRDIEDVNQIYINQLVGGFWPAPRRLKVVVDAGNGMGGPYGPQILTMLGHEVISMFCDLDSDFPNHHPNPDDAANMRDLQAKVEATGADLGLAFDGDADRVGVVDEQGQLVTADRVLAWLVGPVVARYPGAAVVADVLSSQVVFDVVREAGGRPVMWKSGYARVRAKMREEGAIVGGESSGHMFFNDRYMGFDDGIYAAGRIAEMLALSKGPLSEQIASLPQMYLTPEYRPYCPDERKAPIIATVKESFSAKYPVVDVDGVRVLFEEGWGLLRPSGTEEVLSLRFEAHSEQAAQAYKAQMIEALRKAYPELEEI